MVRQILEESRLNKSDFCRSAGISRAQLDRYLQGKTSIGVDTLEELARSVDADVVMNVVRPFPEHYIGLLNSMAVLFPDRAEAPEPRPWKELFRR